MGTKPQSKGLLSKVASIFRTSESGVLDSRSQDSVVSQQSVVGDAEKVALENLIQRKRKDDLVRRREFNYLRKLRRSPHGQAASGGDVSERMSVFPNSSGFSADDRASTLKKIDAIEAHMINSWARSKVAAVSPELGARTERPSPPVVECAPSQPASLQPITRPAPAEDFAAPGELDNLDLDFTGLLSTPGSTAVDTWDAPKAARGEIPTLTEKPDSGIAQEAPRRTPHAPAATLPEPLPDHIESALQDAAIHFAEGDAASAESMLLGLMQTEGISTRTADVLASALFDLYRASGQQAGFDEVAMDYAERFGRSPAEWFSVPALLHNRAPVSGSPASDAALAADTPVWESPRVLTQASVAALRQCFTAPGAVWHVDWALLDSVEPQAAPALAELMALWSAQPVELHWSGVESLLRALAARTPPNDSTVDTLWWRLRLDALCILQRPDDFESLALDYCVVYEVSPPSWKPALCHFVQDQSSSDFGSMAEGPASVPADDFPVLASPFAAAELTGEVCGEDPPTLAQLVAAAGAADHVVVSCALTTRMDFPAAGSLLNWVIAQEGRGCRVQFVQVPRLVAVFFQMLGIDRYARVSVRSN